MVPPERGAVGEPAERRRRGREEGADHAGVRVARRGRGWQHGHQGGGQGHQRRRGGCRGGNPTLLRDEPRGGASEQAQGVRAQRNEGNVQHPRPRRARRLAPDPVRQVDPVQRKVAGRTTRHLPPVPRRRVGLRGRVRAERRAA